MYQSLTILGRLGQDPEMKTTTTGTSVCKFSVAVSKKYKETETTEWFRCVSFGKTGEVIAQHFNKGSLILLQGELKTSTYEKDGEQKYSTEVIVREFSFVGSKDQQQQGNQQQSQQPEYSPKVDTGFASDDIPF